MLSDRGHLIRDAVGGVEPSGTHLGDVGTDEFERDVEFALLSATEETFYEIEEALRRIARGTYGVCEMTGQAIPLARLEAIPWTRYTTEAERELEARGEVGGPHLGELRRVEHGPGEEPQALGSVWAGEGEVEPSLFPVRETQNRSSP